jgi:hypothetical protein
MENSNQCQYVFYLGVARITDGKSFFVANFSFNSETDTDGIRQVVEQTKFELQKGRHYAVCVAQLSLHLIQGKEEDL